MGQTPRILDAGSLRIQLARNNDRWNHAIGFVEDGIFRPVLESLEGAPDDFWPCSPPLQELQIESRGPNAVALLIGQTTKCRWSLSIDVEAEKSLLTFDVACRVPSPESLGTLSSAYRSLAGMPNHSQASWIWLDRLAMQSEPGSSLWPAENGGVIVEADPADFDFPATFRWRYCVAARSADDTPS